MLQLSSLIGVNGITDPLHRLINTLHSGLRVSPARLLEKLLIYHLSCNAGFLEVSQARLGRVNLGPVYDRRQGPFSQGSHTGRWRMSLREGAVLPATTRKVSSFPRLRSFWGLRGGSCSCIQTQRGGAPSFHGNSGKRLGSSPPGLDTPSPGSDTGKGAPFLGEPSTTHTQLCPLGGREMGPQLLKGGGRSGSGYLRKDTGCNHGNNVDQLNKIHRRTKCNLQEAKGTNFGSAG